MKNQRVKFLAHVGIMTAFLAIISQISIPTVFSVPITLQIFAVSLIGFIFPVKKSLLVILVYVSIGAIGVPVFASFQGGVFHLISYTGGFIWGFFPLVLMCSIKKIRIPFGLLGVVLCHLLGVIQYSLVAKISLASAFVTMSLPYILKDFILVALAYVCAKAINGRIKTK